MQTGQANKKDAGIIIIIKHLLTVVKQQENKYHNEPNSSTMEQIVGPMDIASKYGQNRTRIKEQKNTIILFMSSEHTHTWSLQPEKKVQLRKQKWVNQKSSNCQKKEKVTNEW